ncbi:SixA phosphatase family protein [Streptomyces globosus]|uniref:SixA phosphatase family protein n=1 Tax=Streptomyces globosus TaxID=68209 RepID=UPI0013B3AFED|nr:histidine phosphatase family protein [Streptomyces globosus]
MSGIGGSDRRLIVIVRHGKAVPKHTAADPDRDLTARGRRDAGAAGRWLEQSGHRVDLAVSSTSLRTRRTWQMMLPHLSAPPPAYYTEELYHADAGGLLAVLRRQAPELSGILLVGHNPAVHELAAALAGSGTKNLRNHLDQAFPTSSIAVLTVSRPWDGIGPGTARLADLWTPQGG